MANTFIYSTVTGFGLPAASTVGVLTGNEYLPLDKLNTSTGQYVTVNTSVASLFGSIGVTYPTGNVTVSSQLFVTPANGTALTLNGIIGGYSMIAVGGTNSASIIAMQDGNTGQRVWQFRNGSVANGELDFYDNTAGASRLQLPTTGGIVVSAPTSGVAATINSVSGNIGIQVTSGSGATTQTSEILVSRAGSTANAVEEGPNIQLLDSAATTATILQNSGGQTELWQYNGGWNQRMIINSGGQVQFNTTDLYSTGTIISANGLQVRGYSVTAFSGPAAEVGYNGVSAYYQGYNRTSAAYIPAILSGSTVTLAPSGVAALTINTGGNAAIAAPTSGTTLLVNGVSGQNNILAQVGNGLSSNVGSLCTGGAGSASMSCTVSGVIAVNLIANNLGSSLVGVPSGSMGIATAQAAPIVISTNSTVALTVGSTQAVTCASGLAINNGTPTTKPTGYGSPSGTPTASITSGASLTQVAGTLAAFLAYMKTIGFIGA